MNAAEVRRHAMTGGAALDEILAADAHVTADAAIAIRELAHTARALVACLCDAEVRPPIPGIIAEALSNKIDYWEYQGTGRTTG